jgi:hypothetical protein
MNRYIVGYYHRTWENCRPVWIEAESQEAAQAEAQRMLDAREPLANVLLPPTLWTPWQPGIWVAYVWDAGPTEEPTDDREEIPF